MSILFGVIFFMSSCQKTADHTAEILEGINGIKLKNDSLLTVAIQLQKSLDSIKSQINQNTSILNSINTKITGLQVSIDTLISNIKVLNTKIDTANSNLNGLQMQMNNLSKQYLSLSSQISSVFATISVRIDSLNLQLGINNASINKLQTEYLVTQIKVDSILLAIQTNNQLLTNSNANIAAIQTQLVLLTIEYNNVITLLNQLIGLINSQNSLPTSINYGLIAWYPFQGNAVDSSGHGNNGTIYGATLTADRFGLINSAYRFGTNSTISVNNPSVDLNLTGSFSISSWINNSLLSNGYNGSVVLSKHDGDIGNDGWFYGILNYNNNSYHALNFWGYNSLNVSTDPGNSGVVNANVWNNFITTYDANSKILNYYLNGNLVFSVSINLAIISNTKPVTIGFQNSSYGTYYDYFNGAIDDIRIYNRAISAQEVNYLYTH